MTATATTAAEFEALVAEHAAAVQACRATEGDHAAHEAACERFGAAFRAIRAARPTDPAAMAMQIRFLLEYGGPDDDDRPALNHIAEQLEGMAGAPPA
jgi:hypothetical protein